MKKKILFVEDYATLSDTYKIALEAEGYEVISAGTCADAVSAAKSAEPDMVVLDMLLPDEGGMEFLRKYSLKDHPKTKVVVFSNLSSPELFNEAKELGVSKYLPKSDYTPKQLADVIAELL